MSQRDPEEMVRIALQKDELDLLLLGKPPYRYFSLYEAMRESLPYDYNLEDLLNVLFAFHREDPKADIPGSLVRAMMRIVDRYDGLLPIARCILHETVSRSPVDSFGQPKHQESLGLPLEDLANELKQSIKVFGFRLAKDKSGNGKHMPDGLLGTLRALSKVCKRHGGPAFCE